MKAWLNSGKPSTGARRKIVPGGALPLLVVFLVNLGCGQLPRDPEKTTQRIQQGHQLRIGLVENPPWVIRTEGEPAGAEVAIIRQFAASLQAHPKWFWGSEQKHMEALENFELDVVLSGLDLTTPIRSELA